MSANNDEQNIGKKAKRSVGIFPRQPLSKVLDLPRTIYELGHGEPVRRLTVFNALDRSPSSGTSRVLIAAANSGYGLVNGSAASEYLQLTEDGQKIVSAQREPNRFATIYQVLFKNEIFSDFVEHFKDRPLPITEIAIDYLKNTHDLSPSDADVAWDVINENIQEFGLVHELSGRNVLVGHEVALEAIGQPKIEDSVKTEVESILPRDETVKTQIKSEPSTKRITPQIVFNIQVVLPENASAEDYDNIFESIGRHLLSRSE